MGRVYYDHLNNRFESIDDLAEYWGISIDVLLERKKAGMSLKEALTTPSKSKEIKNKKQNHKSQKCKDHLGREFSSKSERASFYGLSIGTIDSRLDSNWSLEKALTAPITPKDTPLRAKKCKDHLGREFSSQKEMASFYGLSDALIQSRLKAGWCLEKALKTKSKKEEYIPNNRISCYDHLGREFSSLKERASFYGLSVGLVASRLSNNWSIERALTTPVTPKDASNIKNSCEDHLGRKFSSKKDRASYYGLSLHLVADRLRSGWTLEKALTTPVREKKTKE